MGLMLRARPLATPARRRAMDARTLRTAVAGALAPLFVI
jgi:hypothetical protein